MKFLKEYVFGVPQEEGRWGCAADTSLRQYCTEWSEGRLLRDPGLGFRSPTSCSGVSHALGW